MATNYSMPLATTLPQYATPLLSPWLGPFTPEEEFGPAPAGQAWWRRQYWRLRANPNAYRYVKTVGPSGGPVPGKAFWSMMPIVPPPPTNGLPTVPSMPNSTILCTAEPSERTWKCLYRGIAYPPVPPHTPQLVHVGAPLYMRPNVPFGGGFQPSPYSRGPTGSFQQAGEQAGAQLVFNSFDVETGVSTDPTQAAGYILSTKHFSTALAAHAYLNSILAMPPWGVPNTPFPGPVGPGGSWTPTAGIWVRATVAGKESQVGYYQLGHWVVDRTGHWSGRCYTWSHKPCWSA